MSIRPDSLMPPREDTRHTPVTASVDVEFIATCVALFDAGFDTQQIALRLFERECAVAIALRIGREALRQEGT